MKRLRYTRANNPPRLLEELLARFPQYAGQTKDGIKTNPRLALRVVGDQITLMVPDDADEAALGTAIAQHFAASRSVNQIREDTIVAAKARLIGYATSNLKLPPRHDEFVDLLRVLGIL